MLKLSAWTDWSLNLRPIRSLMSKMVFSGWIVAWFFTASPINRSLSGPGNIWGSDSIALNISINMWEPFIHKYINTRKEMFIPDRSLWFLTCHSWTRPHTSRSCQDRCRSQCQACLSQRVISGLLSLQYTETTRRVVNINVNIVSWHIYKDTLLVYIVCETTRLRNLSFAYSSLFLKF